MSGFKDLRVWQRSKELAVRFFYIAKGSLAEIQTQLEIAYEIEGVGSILGHFAFCRRLG
jgi:hypothetical protein